MHDKCAVETDARAALNQYLSLQYEFFMTYNRLFLSLTRLLFAKAVPEHWMSEFNSIREKKLQLLAAIIDRGIEQGVFITTDSYRMARALRNIIRGFSIESAENKSDKNDPQKDQEFFKAVLFNGLLKQ